MFCAPAVARIRDGTAPAAVLGEVVRPGARIDDDLRALDTGAAHLLARPADLDPESAEFDKVR